jgi:small redox-active disulfide protein 2
MCAACVYVSGLQSSLVAARKKAVRLGEVNMKIEVLGPGCPKCKTLAANAETAAQKLGVEYELCKVTQIVDIMARGVALTPALVIDGEVKSVGKVLSEADITTLLTSAMS